MKAYAQYIMLNTKGKESDALGSDGVLILDGRTSIDTMVDDAHTQMLRLCIVQPWFIGFDIYKAERFGEGRRVYRYRKEYA